MVDFRPVFRFMIYRRFKWIKTTILKQFLIDALFTRIDAASELCICQIKCLKDGYTNLASTQAMFSLFPALCLEDKQKGLYIFTG